MLVFSSVADIVSAKEDFLKAFDGLLEKFTPSRLGEVCVIDGRNAQFEAVLDPLVAYTARFGELEAVKLEMDLREACLRHDLIPFALWLEPGGYPSVRMAYRPDLKGRLKKCSSSLGLWEDHFLDDPVRRQALLKPLLVDEYRNLRNGGDSALEELSLYMLAALPFRHLNQVKSLMANHLGCDKGEIALPFETLLGHAELFPSDDGETFLAVIDTLWSTTRELVGA